MLPTDRPNDDDDETRASGQRQCIHTLFYFYVLSHERPLLLKSIRSIPFYDVIEPDVALSFEIE